MFVIYGRTECKEKEKSQIEIINTLFIIIFL